MRLCYYPAASGICSFTHVTRERIPTGSERYYYETYLQKYVGIIDRSEFVTHVTSQNHHASTHRLPNFVKKHLKYIQKNSLSGLVERDQPHYSPPYIGCKPPFWMGFLLILAHTQRDMCAKSGHEQEGGQLEILVCFYVREGM